MPRRVLLTRQFRATNAFPPVGERVRVFSHGEWHDGFVVAGNQVRVSGEHFDSDVPMVRNVQVEAGDAREGDVRHNSELVATFMRDLNTFVSETFGL